MVFVLPNLKNVYCLGKLCFRYTYVLYLIVPLILLLLFFISRDFIKLKNKKEMELFKQSKKTMRIMFMVTRSLLLASILFAIASPFVFKEHLVAGEPSLIILADNSSSFDIFDHGVADELYKKLSDKIKVEMRHIASAQSSPIGDAILNNMQGNDNLLIVSDGYSNDGKLLGDVVSFATGLNSTVYTVDIKPIKDDAGVYIEGVSQAIVDTEENFHVKIRNTGKDVSYTVEVSVDDSPVLITSGKGTASYTITKKFSSGYHAITAKLSGISENDYFPQNNIYYKTVKVVERPRILFVTEKPSPLQDALGKLYVVEPASVLPNELDKYLAVLINDIPAGKLNGKLEQLSNYVADGSGIIVVGGQNSYDRGNYKGSLFETLLPVKTGVTEEVEKSDVNIAIVIDISHGTEDYVAVEKALALSVMDSLGMENNVGAVAFNSEAYQLDSIKTLKDHYDFLKDRISRLVFDKQSRFDLGIKGAATMLRQASGSKNIILITDGKTTYDPLKEWTLDAVIDLANKGVKTYVVGVGERRDDEFLTNLATAGNGIYFPADASNKMKIIFGEASKKKEAEFYNNLIILESTHFITYNTSLNAIVNGYNLVIPKPQARPLIITNKNIPILVVSRFGLGRVVSLATDDGGKWGGELLSRDNSKILTKTINWAIGDLSRKKDFDVNIKDTMLFEETPVNVIAKEIPKSGLFFVKTDVNTYSASFVPNSTGIFELLDAKYAVNYAEEYNELGINPDFIELVRSNGGEIFEPNDIDTIVATIKKVSKRIKNEEVDYRHIFVTLAIILFLFDIGARRYMENMAIIKQ